MKGNSLNEAFRRFGSARRELLSAAELTPGDTGGMPYEDPFGTISVLVDRAIAPVIDQYTMTPRQVEQLRAEIKSVTFNALAGAFEHLREGYIVNVPREGGGLTPEQRRGLSYDEVKRASVTKATMEFARKAAEEALLNFKPEVYAEEWGTGDLPDFHYSDWAKSSVSAMRGLLLGEPWSGVSY